MLISINWLKDYLDLDGITPEEVSEKLTACGLEVDEYIDKKKEFENIVVGYVKERKQHPNADKLSVCIVNDGKDDFEVVCGAPNVDAGQKIVFAKVGAVIPNGGFKISKAKLRGQVSHGMICSEQELGLGDNHDGIMVLPEDTEVGSDFADYLGLDDVIVDIAITPNRADALSHWGVARDLAAIFNRETKFPDVSAEETDIDVNEYAKIKIENQDGCPRYIGKVVTDVTIKESPEWLKKKLISIGSRPINNVVDITNFVLHEMGQPLHAFDLDELSGNTIIVKNAGDQKKFVTLDSKERNLDANDLMICDAEKAVAIAGVMGGENSEVTNKTKNILIESAYFDPSSVRKTAKQLGLSTDASYRFERGTNPEIAMLAAKRTAKLIAELGGGKIAKGEIDVYPKKLENIQVNLRFARVKKILGFEIDKALICEILSKLELKIVNRNENDIDVEVPYFRHDIEREIDLIEEIVRVYGYDNIPPVERIANNLEAKTDAGAFLKEIKTALSGLGFYEILTNSLLSDDIANQFGNAISIVNPQSQDMSHMRTSLIPGMLATISRNLKVKENNLLLYETGHVFEQLNKEGIEEFSDLSETEHVLIAVCGVKVDTEWYNNKKVKYDFYDLKGYAEEFLSNLNLSSSIKDDYKNYDKQLFEYGYNKIFRKDTLVAKGGKLKSEIANQFGIDEEVFLFDMNISELAKINRKQNTFAELLKYPKVYRDFAFVFDFDINYSSVIKSIEKNSSKLLKKVNLFDIFESDSLGKGKKSMAFQLEYFDNSRTLTEEEVDKDFWNVIEKIKNEFNAELRG